MPTSSDLLQEAAVRIDIGGEPNGSGFFISPAYVVTCYHVIEPHVDTSTSARPTLEVFDTGGKAHEVTGSPLVDRESDLALLQLAVADPHVVPVLLADQYTTHDTLQAFGFPAGKRNGEPTTFLVEGLTGDPVPWFKFKQGQVRPGMSGSPLLNLRTGAVCAVLKRTRNEETDLGGYGIRVLTLQAVFDKVTKLNSEAHGADQRWLTSLNPQQLRLVRPRAAAMKSYTEFVLKVSQAGDDWQVSASAFPGGEVATVKVDLNEVRTEVPRLFRAWKAQRRMDEGQQSRLLGKVLYRSIIPRRIGDDLERLKFSDRTPVHVSLHFEPKMDPDLVHLPWEHLFIDRGNTKSALGTETDMTFTRVASPEPAHDPPPPLAEACVRMLGGPSRGYPELWTAVDTVVRTLEKQEGLVCDNPREREPTREELDGKGWGGVDVVHYLGYGRYHSSEDELAMPLSDNDCEFVGLDWWGPTLSATSARLVVLQTLAPTAELVPVDPTAFAMTLIDRGIEAVVAFPYPLTGADASSAATTLYKRLAEGMSIRAAVQSTRRSLLAAPWSRPALFLRRPSDVALLPIASGG